MEQYPTLKKSSVQSISVTVTVSREEANLLRKIQKIVQAGKNVEIKGDKNGKIKVLKVSKELA